MGASLLAGCWVALVTVPFKVCREFYLYVPYTQFSQKKFFPKRLYWFISKLDFSFGGFMQSVGQLEKRLRRSGNSLHRRMQVHGEALEVLAEAVDSVETAIASLRALTAPEVRLSKPLKKSKK